MLSCIRARSGQTWVAPLLFVAGIAALLCCLPVGSAARAKTPQAAPEGPNPASCGFEWAYYGAGVPQPNGLRDIAAIAADDVWAVGTHFILGDPFPLLEHWDGSNWSVKTPPEIEGEANSLAVVSAIATDNVWVFGSSEAEDVVPLHWDGKIWSSQPGPAIDFEIYDGVAISDTDIWLVGSRAVSGMAQGYATHWNGNSWTTMPVPGGAHAEGYLEGVAAVTPDDIWVIGNSTDGSIDTAFTAHWDGSSWTPVPLPDLGTLSFLYDIDATAPDDAWVVGSYFDTKAHGVVLHWDGIEWTEAPAPDSSPQAVVAFAPYDVWTLGTGEFIRAAHYNGYKWAASPGPDIPPTVLNMAATGVETGELWLAATSAIGKDTRGSITHYREVFVAYADVPVEDEFFPYITCLSCAGIVNGYPCGGQGEPCDSNNNPYFRPGTTVTRGQIAKIVALVAGLGGIPTSQTFEDVPPGSTFHTYIENLAALEVMSGYPCGGPGEPCVPPDNRPYFRPNATASRGQVAKIASNAAEFNDPIPPGTQTFADAPEGSPFHPYIERLAARGVMEGYPCGGPGEPCDDENRPYFRPGSTVTRGQTTKIAANTFLLNCPTGEPR